MTSVLLIAAILTTGWMAGLFFAYSNNVMPALGLTADAVFVDVMRHVNRVIQNPLFLLAFLGALLFGAAATVGAFVSRPPAVAVWALVGTVLYAAQLAVTFGANIPLNNAIDRATDPIAARAAFERRWVRLNHLRTALCTASLTAYAVGLAG